MEEEKRKAEVLLEALPYIRLFSGAVIVIKYGGHAMIDEELKKGFALNVVLLKYIGLHPVIVHGGGPQIGSMLDQLGIASRFCQGLRVTDAPTMDVVEMVLCGKVNKEIVNLLNVSGGRAVGLSGKDGNLIQARQLSVSKETGGQAEIDLGQVGEVQRIETALVHSLQQDGFIPVIAPVGVDAHGKTYNINADSVAGAIASAMRAKKLIILTDVPGVLNEQKELVSSLTMEQARQAISSGMIQGGMIPKIECCLEALQGGVEKTHILDGRQMNCLVLELFTKSGTGTQIVSSALETETCLKSK